MNVVDSLLVVVVLLSMYAGYNKGFILGIGELLGWLVSLLAFIVLYSPISHFLSEIIGNALLTFALTFILVLLAVRLLFFAVADRLIARIPAVNHELTINKAAGTLPGFVNGIVYAALISVVLLIIPLRGKLERDNRASILASRFRDHFQQWQSKLPIDLSLPSATVIPGKGSKEKLIKLPFAVTDFKARPDLEIKMLAMVNSERKKAGLAPVSADREMTGVARKHSADMFKRSYFSHFTPEGKSPFDRMRADGVKFITAGENLALAPTLNLAHTGLMNSPGHRANILHPAFGRLGIGILDGGVHGLMVTQNFRN